MNKTILHLDDEEQIRQIVAELLTTEGYRVWSTGNPSEALAAVRAEAPDLIIADLQLDEDDGQKAIAQLLEIRPATPVIILTGVLLEPRVFRETMGGFASAYIEKTRPLAEILTEVTKLIGPGR